VQCSSWPPQRGEHSPRCLRHRGAPLEQRRAGSPGEAQRHSSQRTTGSMLGKSRQRQFTDGLIHRRFIIQRGHKSRRDSKGTRAQIHRRFRYTSSVRVGVCGVCVCSGDLELKKRAHTHKKMITKTKKESPNTGARANNTLHK